MNTHITAAGNASRNAELKQSSNGNEYAVVNMAVTIEDKRDDTDNPPPWWLRIMAFGRSADQLCAVEKGDRLVVTGTLKRSRYTSNDGKPRESWTVFADQVHAVRRPPQDNATTGPAGDDPNRGDPDDYEGSIPF